MTTIAKCVEVLHCPVGNLWDIYVNDVFACRVTYHGNKLHEIRSGNIAANRKEVEAAINALYE